MWKSLFLALTLLSFNARANLDPNVQWAIHFISYIGSDYSGAVKENKIINKAEYLELVDLSNECIKLNKKWKKDSKVIQELLNKLKEKIEKKVSPKEILKLTSKIQNKIIQLHKVITIPNVIPDLYLGKRLFNEKCITCHGTTGNGKGKLAKGLNPAPTNFLDRKALIHKAPYHYTNSITLGVPATAMKGYKYSQKELWSLAHYIRSLTYGGVKSYKKNELAKVDNLVNITHLSAYSDQDLNELLKSYKERDYLIKILRSAQPVLLEYVYFKVQTLKHLRQLLEDIKRSQYAHAKEVYKKAYAYSFEYIEPILIKNYGSLGVKLERKMLLIKTMLNKNSKSKNIEVVVTSMIEQLESL